MLTHLKPQVFWGENIFKNQLTMELGRLLEFNLVVLASHPRCSRRARHGWWSYPETQGLFLSRDEAQHFLRSFENKRDISFSIDYFLRILGWLDSLIRNFSAPGNQLESDARNSLPSKTTSKGEPLNNYLEVKRNQLTSNPCQSLHHIVYTMY